MKILHVSHFPNSSRIGESCSIEPNCSLPHLPAPRLCSTALHIASTGGQSEPCAPGARDQRAKEGPRCCAAEKVSASTANRASMHPTPPHQHPQLLPSRRSTLLVRSQHGSSSYARDTSTWYSDMQQARSL